jgi:hypothetical protein
MRTAAACYRVDGIEADVAKFAPQNGFGGDAGTASLFGELCCTLNRDSKEAELAALEARVSVFYARLVCVVAVCRSNPMWAAPSRLLACLCAHIYTRPRPPSAARRCYASLLRVVAARRCCALLLCVAWLSCCSRRVRKLRLFAASGWRSTGVHKSPEFRSVLPARPPFPTLARMTSWQCCAKQRRKS